jgi:hypothetical protein
MADIVIEKIFKQPVYTWVGGNLVKKDDARMAYLNAIGAADAGDIQPLLIFARA